MLVIGLACYAWAQGRPGFDGCYSVAMSPNDVPYFLCQADGRHWIVKYERGSAENIGDVEAVGNLKFGPDGAMYGISKVRDKVYKLLPGGQSQTICEKGDQRITQDALARARINFEGLCINRQGDVYVSDVGNGWLIMISSSGDVQRVAGADPVFEGAGDGAKLLDNSLGMVDGPGLQAKLRNPAFICAGPKGEIYISEGSSGVVRKYENGQVTTIAGAFDMVGNSRTGLRDGPGNSALFAFWLRGIACDSQGNVFVVDAGNRCIRQLVWNQQAGMYYVYTLAGSPKNPEADKDGTNLEASFDGNWKDIVVDSKQNLYVTKHADYIVRKITWLGVVSSFDIS